MMTFVMLIDNRHSFHIAWIYSIQPFACFTLQMLFRLKEGWGGTELVLIQSVTLSLFF